MPELPEVETVVRELRAGGLVGRVITRAQAFWKPMIAPLTPAAFAARLKGKRIQAIHRRAKYIVLTLAGGEAPRGKPRGIFAEPCDLSGAALAKTEAKNAVHPCGSLLRRSKASGCDLPSPTEAGFAKAGGREPLGLLAKKGDTLLIHLRMTGQLSLGPPSAPRAPHEHVVLRLDDGRELRYRDTRKFGRWILTCNPDAILGRLGPEPLASRFSPHDFTQRLSGRRRQLKPLLLDQTFLAGIGNIYADEALWAARLHPRRDASTLTASETRRLHGAIRRVLRRGIQTNGTTLGKGQSNFRRPGGERGRHQESLKVFRKTSQPCLRCGKSIRRMIIGQRATHICPNCQPEDDAGRQTPDIG